MRRRYRKKAINDYGKYANEAIRISSKIIKIETQNQIFNKKFKTVFYCSSSIKPEGRMCVIWDRTTFKEGDEIDMTGRMKDNVFLVWRYIYKPSQTKG